MSFTEQVLLIKRMHQLIKLKATGPPDEFAKRLEISRASLFRYLNELKNLGAPVTYCKAFQSYYYEESYELVL